MRINWQQSLEGCSLLHIRNILRAVHYTDTPFGPEFIAARLEGGNQPPSRSALNRAKRLLKGLLASGLIEAHQCERHGLRYVLTATGISLRAARATKRLNRERADKAIARLLRIADEINGDPIFLHDVAGVAVFGSYIGDSPDLGDIDVAINLRARWKRGLGADSDHERRKRAFDEQYPPPPSFYEKHWWRSWAETYTKRLLRADPAMVIIEQIELENIGCPYRLIYPTHLEVAAKPGWSFERGEIVLLPPREQD